MAVLPGNKISISDLSALAGLANGKSSLSKNVSPLYTDGSGQPYGYKTFSGVAVDPLHPGTGYKVGDALTLGFGSIFAVAQVSATGAVLGIRVVNSGQGQYNDPTWNGTSGTQIANGGGSGTGCQLLNTFTHVGPTANYSFPDFSPTDGVITGFYLVDGGTGYTNGDTLTVNFSLWTASTLTVASVDGAGKILTFTLAALGSPVLPATVPQNVASVGATGGTGSGAKVGAYFTLNPNPNWLTELNRLRADLASFNMDKQSAISGVWPVSGYVNSFSANATDIVFYYANSTAAQTVTISSNCNSFYPDEIVADILAGTSRTSDTYSSLTFEIIIGGDKNVVLSGGIMVQVLGTGGTPSLVATSTIPGVSGFSLLASGGGYFDYGALVSASCPPGTYQISISSLVNCKFSSFVLQNPGGPGGGPLTCSYTESAHSLTNGIHNSLPVYKIICPETPLGTFPFGVFGKSATNMYYAGLIEFFIGKAAPGGGSYLEWGGYLINWCSSYPSLTASCYGFFTAKTPMVSSLNAVPPILMPWNLTRTKYGSVTSVSVNPSLLGDLAANIANVAKISNSYDQTLPVELQAEPPGWIANRYFTEGFTIMDGNGNLQICGRAGISGATAPSWGSSDGAYTVEPYGSDPRYNLGWACVQALTSTGSWSAGAAISSGQTIKDSNGNTQYCTSAGTTGSIVPTWPTRVGVSTTDGTVQWQMRCPFTPAIHRPQSIPVYPFYWQGDSTLPTTWVAATAYALNATVIDANGNTQKCTTAGTSAATAPVWSQTLAGVTSDGSTLKWTLLTLAAETNAFLKPPTATSGLTRWGANNQWQRNNYHSPSYDAGWQQDNLAFGWWIYSVSLNRFSTVPKTINGVGAGDPNVGAGDTGMDTSGVSGSEVNVTIGCMRNGAFVSFGTWATGQTIQVLWPVFTSDALVYQCGERIDLQAVAISSGCAGVSLGATAAGYPMCAAFVSDTTKLLNLIP
jgi:hypothetical protein